MAGTEAGLENHMLLIAGAVVLIAVLLIPRMRMLGRVHLNTLGWVSTQWLAEHRAAHSA